MSASPNDTQAAQDESGNAPKDKRKRGRALLIALLVFVLAGVIWLLLWLFVFSTRETTDDAYVGGNQVAISAQVPGIVVGVYADDTQRVNAGQVLVRLDPTDADVALRKAGSALAQAVRQVRQQTQSAASADAALVARRQDLKRAQDDLKRRLPLLAEKAVAPEEVQHARDAVTSAQSALDAAQRQADAARALVDGSNVEDNPAVAQARANFRQAWVAAQRNAIVAPIDGYVALRGVQVGNSVQPGQQLMTVVPLHDLWVDANFKEGQLRHVRIGQPAKVEADIYGGGVEYHGKVIGLGAGTGSAFSLLPAQNATGNWIKVVQRVPVRIALDPKDLDKHPLRIGLSTAVTVDITDDKGDVLPSQPSNVPVAQTRVYDDVAAKADAAADAIVRANLGAGVP
ncbi:HlyD family efflux transporter periplasmic adaptor subunit [Luteibacter jiangsuensis]|uniref:HlyD family efflux transporter periplasmic adaptor subunit n=1 Tax=Luteibacter jiangsuensis TaxID=637577 RepID=A0ABX0Q9Z5_9GAMM|nr:HlyD family efflux transporter periplasmic adaptor subunit [Luteibacter jiangsuensis]NID05968.1 HlyD family efflux transporter periplasmic adaptor subunit [Luteibacter jiangsuensis]